MEAPDVEQTPFKPMNAFLSDIFDHKRDDPAEIPTDISRSSKGQEFQRFLSQNPKGLGKSKVKRKKRFSLNILQNDPTKNYTCFIKGTTKSVIRSL